MRESRFPVRDAEQRLGGDLPEHLVLASSSPAEIQPSRARSLGVGFAVSMKSAGADQPEPRPSLFRGVPSAQHIRRRIGELSPGPGHGDRVRAGIPIRGLARFGRPCQGGAGRDYPDIPVAQRPGLHCSKANTARWDRIRETALLGLAHSAATQGENDSPQQSRYALSEHFAFTSCGFQFPAALEFSRTKRIACLRGDDRVAALSRAAHGSTPRPQSARK